MPVQSDAYFVALRDEVKAEIAKIEAEEIGLEELVEKLALTRVRLRRMQAYAIDQKRILARYRGRVKSLVGDVEKQVNARRKYADRLENSIKKMHELLPMAFEEGKKAIAVRGATARHAETEPSSKMFLIGLMPIAQAQGQGCGSSGNRRGRCSCHVSYRAQVDR